MFCHTVSHAEFNPLSQPDDCDQVPSNLWEKQPFELEQITWEGVEEDDGFFDFKFPADMTSTGTGWLHAPWHGYFGTGTPEL